MRKLTALAFFFGLLLFSAAVFTVSGLLPDKMIEPKWYAAGFGAACDTPSAAQAFFVFQEKAKIFLFF